MLYKKGQIVVLYGTEYLVMEDMRDEKDKLKIRCKSHKDFNHVWEHVDGDYRCSLSHEILIYKEAQHLFKLKEMNNREALRLLRRD